MKPSEVPKIDPIAQSVLFRVQRVVNGQHLYAIREALLGGEPEMLTLLSLLPGYPVSPLLLILRYEFLIQVLEL